MQREIAAMNRQRGAPISRAESFYDSRDGEGYSPPAPAPPKPAEDGGPVSNVLAQPLPQVSLAGPLKVQRVNLEERTISTTYGDFPLDSDGAAVIAGIAVAALQTHFNSMVEQAARAYGIWGNVPASTPAERAGTDTNVLTQPPPATPSATSTGRAVVGTSPGGTRRKGRRGN